MGDDLVDRDDVAVLGVDVVEVRLVRGRVPVADGLAGNERPVAVLESVEDGRLSVFVMRKKTRRSLVAASIRALFNRTRPDDMVRLDDVQRLRVASRRSQLVISIDGEVEAATPPLDYRVRKAALNVIAP